MFLGLTKGAEGGANKLRTIKTARFWSRVFLDVNLIDSHQKIAERQNIYILEVRCFLAPQRGAKKLKSFIRMFGNYKYSKNNSIKYSQITPKTKVK